MLGGLVVHDVQLWFESLSFQFVKVLLVGIEYADVIQTCYGLCEDGV